TVCVSAIMFAGHGGPHRLPWSSGVQRLYPLGAPLMWVTWTKARRGYNRPRAEVLMRFQPRRREMGAKPSNVKQTDVRRAIKAIEAAGLKVGQIMFEGHTFVIVPADAAPTSDLDRELEEFERGQA